MTSVAEVARDLADEHLSLDAIVTPLSDRHWDLATPSPGWTVADQIGHLSYFDRTAALALSDVDAFREHRDRFLQAATVSPTAADDLTLAQTRTMAPGQLLEHWRAGRRALSEAAATLTDDVRVEWYGPAMSSRSFLTARLMEAWAHGQDIVDTVGATRPPTDRLRHVARLGVMTRSWSYVNRGLEAPPGDVRVELEGPGGDMWVWGDPAAADRVTGPALDFCLVVTQRRHVDDTALEMRGADALDWMLRAQAFAGPATQGPASRRSV